MTHDNSRLIVSDGSNNIYYINPLTFEITDSFSVEDTININELELVHDLLYANQFLTSDILVISLDGKLRNRIDMSELL